MKYKITLSYDGTDYVGWQVQPNGISIQGVVEESLKKLFGKEIRVVGASRTDAGVHAHCQAAHFELESDVDPARIGYGLNAILPFAIRVKEVLRVAPSFHAQYSALNKIYHYHLYREKQDDPFRRLYHYHYHKPLNLPLMQAGAHFLEGTHDFTSFANKGSSAKTFTRTISRFQIVEEGSYLRFECEGGGFLYKMVRNLVSALMEVGKEKLSLEELKAIFSEQDRRRAPPPAPARGLSLVKIVYPS